MWDVATGEMIKVLGHNWNVNAVVISSDGRTAITRSGNNEVVVWDLATGAKLSSPLPGVRSATIPFVQGRRMMHFSGGGLPNVGCTTDVVGKEFATVKGIVAWAQGNDVAMWRWSRGGGG